MDEGDVIRAGTDMRDEIADPLAAFAPGLPVPWTLHHGTRVALKKFHPAAGIELFAAAFDELRLVVKRVALARGARHEQLNDASGARGVMQTAVQNAIRLRRHNVRKQTAVPEQVAQGNSAQTA